jgi:hypothetical protein
VVADSARELAGQLAATFTCDLCLQTHRPGGRPPLTG